MPTKSASPLAVPIGPTSDQQKMNPSDRAIAQKIRKAIHRDKTLSVYARNIKIFVQNGKITLCGLAQTPQEKANLEAKAEAVAGLDSVTNELEIAQSR